MTPAQIAEAQPNGARVEAEFPAPVGQAFVDAIPPPVAQGGWLLGLFTALLTITPKSDYLRAVWDGDRL
jgi:hypothetical protein